MKIPAADPGPIWRCRGRELDLGARVAVMGILNVTPDSFSDGGQFLDAGRAVEHGLRMVEEGADILDLGAESTRPGALPVEAQEEIRRLRPVVEGLRRQTTALVSVDTTKSDVARAMLDLGADILNDVSALRADPAMGPLAAQSGSGLVLMHMLGSPATMQANPHYDDVIEDIAAFLQERVAAASEAGVDVRQIAVDPGLGFGKTVEHNLRILARAKAFCAFGRPVLLGPSRKSFIGKVLNLEVGERLEGTAAAVAASVLNGASIVRVHDVRAMRRVADLAAAIRTQGT